MSIQKGKVWLKEHLFSNVFNSVLSILSILLLILCVPPLIRWGIYDANFIGQTRRDCTASGACWPFIIQRFQQFMYGFYPEGSRWRVNLSAIMLIVMTAQWFMSRLSIKSRFMNTFILTLAILILLIGGVFGLSYVPTHNWGGLFLTVVLAVSSIVCSFPLALFLALGRQSTMPLTKAVCVVLIEFIRGIPLITVLFMASVMLPMFLPEDVNLDKLFRAFVGITLFQAAYLAEVIRGGLMGLDKGQHEAADALGLSYWRKMALVILPQALKMMIPGIVNTFIALFKDTTLVLIIGLLDFLSIVQTATQDPNWLGSNLEGYVFCAVVYFLFCFGLSRYSIHLERKFDTGRRV